MRHTIVAVALTVVLGFVATACSSGSDDETLDVVESEYLVKPAKTHLDAGKVTLKAENVGTMTHEIVVVRGTTDALPKAADGSVDEDKIPETDNVGEIEDIASGSHASKEFDLSPGSYVLFCNIVDDTTHVSHFAKGMHAEITVG
jgi:hypothetical protein